MSKYQDYNTYVFALIWKHQPGNRGRGGGEGGGGGRGAQEEGKGGRGPRQRPRPPPLPPYGEHDPTLNYKVGLGPFSPVVFVEATRFVFHFSTNEREGWLELIPTKI